MKKKLVWVWTLLLALVLVSVPFGIWRALAAAPPYQIKILEIVDNPNANGTYPLAVALKDTKSVTVESMRMKKFVALRDELDGKYDAIYFGSGKYLTAKPATFSSQSLSAQEKAHDTTNQMNDITQLKVTEITNKYISKQLPVIFNTDIAVNQSAGTLRSFYNAYLNQPSSSVSYVGTTGTLTFENFVKKLQNGDASFKQRPQLNVTSKPVDFLTSSTTVYKTGDTLTFNFDANYVKDFSSPVNVKLYASVDKVLPMTDANIVASKTITAPSGTISYTLPQTFSGPVYWRLVLSANNQNDYASGAFRVQDQKTVIRVLQVMPSNDASSLLKPTNMTQAYLKTTDYDIQITPILFSEFNTASNANSYANLNGKYDMVLFGFIDNYNSQTSGSLTDAAANGVNEFIKTGQAVMFTHDTMIGNSSNPWIKNFQKTTGQTGLYTNLGLGAPNKSTRTSIVNSGMLTQFPFNLSLPPSNAQEYVGQILLTHNQYYMLDLEDPEIVPWYNIVSESGDTYKRDSDDSYDHYYTYSKGNVTYSGTGHTNTGFKEWEQKLFVNTMFRAFIGSNHAPTIQVITPEANDRTLPSYLGDLSFSYKVNDLDIKDANLTASVRVSINGQYRDDLAIAKKSVRNGEVITGKFQNPLAIDGGTIQIEITATDSQGAQAIQTVDLIIEKKEAILKPSRTISNATADRKFKVGEPVQIDYKVEPQNIEISKVTTNGTPLQTLEITKVKYTETLPPNLDFPKSPTTGLAVLPEGVVIDGGNATDGYVISKTFSQPIVYNLSADRKSYKAKEGSNIAFTLTVIPKQMQETPYNLNKARLSYVDFPQPVVDPSASALKFSKDYSLILTGTTASSINGGTIQGSIVSNADINFNAFAIGNKTVISNKNLNFSTPGSGASISNSSIWAGGNLLIGNVGISGSQLSTVGNLTLSGQSLDVSSSAAFGGTIDKATVRAIKDTPAAIQNRLNERLAASGISDFASMVQSFNTLSDSYKIMPANGKVEPKWGNLYLNGTDPNINVFNINTDVIPLSRTNLSVPPNSTTIINVTGSKPGFTDGFVTSGTTTQSLLVNYVGTGTFTVSNADIYGTLLAPNATVAFTGSKVQGKVIANKITGNAGIYNESFTGTAPPSSVQPTPGKNQTIIFPPVDFQVPVLVSSIKLQDNFIWINDTLPITAEILPKNAADPSVTWKSDNPSIVSILEKGTTINSTTITGLAPGTTKIWAVANDGSGIKQSAEVTVAAIPLFIEGSRSVNLNGTIRDLTAVVKDKTLELTNIRWTLAGGTGNANGNQNAIATLNNPLNGATVSLTGNKIGTVDVQLTATVIKRNTAGTVISSRDWTAPVHTVTVVNPLESITIAGPDWVPVTKTGSASNNSVSLSSTIQPAGAVLKSVVWSISQGEGSGRLTNTASTGTPLTNSLNSLDKTGSVTVKVVATAEGSTVPIAPAFKSIRVVDVETKGPEAIYFNTDPVRLSSDFVTADAENWTVAQGRPDNYVWKVENLKQDASGNWVVDSSSTPPYAQLSDTNTAAPSLSPSNSGLEGKVRVTVTVGGMTSTKDIDVKARLTALQLPPEIPIQRGQQINLNLLLNPVPGVMVNKLSEILPALQWSSSVPNSASVTPNVVPAANNVTGGIVTGLQPGTSTVITVTYPAKDGMPAVTTTTKVIVMSGNNPETPTDPTDPVDPTNPGGPVGDNLY